MTRREGRRGRRAASGGAATIAAGADPGQLLPMALHHHEKGDLSRARALYEQVIAARPDHADALQFFGILCNQEGDAARAESLIRRAIAINPRVAPYHDNLGTVLEKAGRLEEALAAYEVADALEPGDPDRGYNMGLALASLGRVEDAERCLRRALEARPEDVESRFALGNLLKQRGALDQARGAYRLVLNASPRHAGALVNLGNLLQDGGSLDEARGLYERAIAAAPRDAAAHHNLGRLLRREGRPADARACFEQALRHAPTLVDARIGLGQSLEDLARLEQALAVFRDVCRDRPDSREGRSGLVRVVRVLAPSQPDPMVEDVLASAIEGGRVTAASLARALGVLVAAKAGLEADAPPAPAEALALAQRHSGDRLFRLLMERAPNVVPAVERWLTAARRALMLAGSPPASSMQPLLHALAVQCTANEHAFATTSDEEEASAVLGGRIEAWLADGAGATPPGDEELALYACYAPLARLAGAGALARRIDERGAWLQDVLQRSLAWPLEEADLQACVAELAPIDDEASTRVRAQYEENPYPLWSELPAMAGSGAGRDRLAPRLDAREGLDILVAGCGTGQEPLALASRFPGHRVVALDLSRASLAYGVRMARRLGISDVEFVHGDLVHAGRLGRRFDLITATGVLHHMAEPRAGLDALVACLAHDGLMRIGLYSRAARAAVNVARERIAALGLQAHPGDVRALRQRVLEGSEPPLRSLLDSEDFYTISACRDLLFHPVEHQFDLEQVSSLLDGAGLRFLGFELPHPLLERRFHDAGTGGAGDLRAWARFERDDPHAFEAMYVLWCERLGTGGEPSGA